MASPCLTRHPWTLCPRADSLATPVPHALPRPGKQLSGLRAILPGTQRPLAVHRQLLTSPGRSVGFVAMGGLRAAGCLCGMLTAAFTPFVGAAVAQPSRPTVEVQIPGERHPVEATVALLRDGLRD